MTEHETPEALEAAAEAEVREADETLAALEQRVLNDDDGVTPVEIETARSVRHFAGLRLQAARRKAEALREKQREKAREAAYAEARQVLAETSDEDVQAAVEAAGEAMARLRETVRARNACRDRALRVLQACPAVERRDPEVGRIRGTSRPVYPELGYGLSEGEPLLWVGGKSLPLLDEGAVMDEARRMPAARDYERARTEQAAARERQVERDAGLYRSNRAAFEALPARRRQPALERLGVDWGAYLDEREQAMTTQAQGA
jgi:hypothetical protein